MGDKYKVLAIFGKSASGKDSLAKMLNAHMKDKSSLIVSCTTRPKRDYEINGTDYHFITKNEFNKLIGSKQMLEYTSFNYWMYGTPIDSLKKDKINIGVFNLRGVQYLLSDGRLDVFPVYIECADKIRLIRSLAREAKPDCYEICRRFMADEYDFNPITLRHFPYEYTSLISTNASIDDTLNDLISLDTFKRWAY